MEDGCAQICIGEIRACEITSLETLMDEVAPGTMATCSRQEIGKAVSKGRDAAGHEAQRQGDGDRDCTADVAGASAPEVLVNQVVARLQSLGGGTVSALEGIVENVSFPLPKGLSRTA